MRKEMLVVGSVLLLFVAGCSAQGAPGVPVGAPAPVTAPAPATVRGVSASASTPAQAAPMIPAPTSGRVAVSGTAAAPPSPVATEPVKSAPAPAPTPAQPPVLINPTSVTMADNGATVQLSPGSRFLLNLGSPPDWSVTIADQNVLARVPNIMVVRGAQGIYTAKTAGTTTLSAVGTFPCQLAKIRCMIASPLFHITVDVKD